MSFRVTRDHDVAGRDPFEAPTETIDRPEMRSLTPLVDPQREDANPSDENEDDQIRHTLLPWLTLVCGRPRAPRVEPSKRLRQRSELSRGPKKRDDGVMAHEPFGDIPLFRELQRLLASSGGGPINFEIARQVAAASSTQGPADIPPSDQQTRVLSDAVSSAEQLVAGYSRIQIDEPTRGAMLTRSSWIAGSMDGWRWLLEHLATRFTGELAGMSGGTDADQIRQVMGQVGPLLLGLQTGTLIGSLSIDVLDTTDPPIPRDGENGFRIVIGNVLAFASDFDLDAEELIRWLALHGVAHSLTSRGSTWIARYQRGLLLQLVDAIEVDTEQLEQRLIELQSGSLEALAQAQPSDRSIPVAETERHRIALDRVRAFVALLEGYSGHIAAEVESQLVTEPARIQESVARHRASPSEGKTALASLLGFSSDRELETAGRTFCEAIVKLEGLISLNRVWEAPDNLPNLTEIRDPFLWIDRVLKQV